MLTVFDMSKILFEHDWEKKTAMIDAISDKDIASFDKELADLDKEVKKLREYREKRHEN